MDFIQTDDGGIQDDTANLDDMFGAFPDPEDDAFAAIDSLGPTDDAESQDCVLHSYDSTVNSRGERVILRTGTRAEYRYPTYEDRAALVHTRIYDASKSLDRTELMIRSPYIKEALRSVIKSYPGTNIGSVGNIQLKNEPRCLFHYRKELYTYAQGQQSQAREHIILCLRYMYRVLWSPISLYRLLMQGDKSLQGLDFENLWMAFKPGSFIYHRKDGVHQIFKLLSIPDSHFRSTPSQEMYLELERIECDGTNFGRVMQEHIIKRYDGFKFLVQLPYYPLEFHPAKDDIKDELIARGRKFISLLGIHHRSYSGMARMCHHESTNDPSTEMETMEVYSRQCF